MKEENKGTPKSKWSRLYRKKWFFPAIYLGVAALLLSGVIWVQNTSKEEAAEDLSEEDLYEPNLRDEDALPVMEQDEMVQMPVKEDVQTNVVTKFYDYDAEKEERLDALIFHNSRYYQSTGIDLQAEDGETFDVLASLSGEVLKVKEDPLYGNVVSLDHGDDVETYYASLDEVDVKAGDKVKQGDVLGRAGKNLFGKDNGIHVHFELRKHEQAVNPEAYLNQPVSKIEVQEEEQAVEKSEDPATEENPSPEDDAAEDEGDQEAEKGPNPFESDAPEDETEEDDAEGDEAEEEESDSTNEGEKEDDSSQDEERTNRP